MTSNTRQKLRSFRITMLVVLTLVLIFYSNFTYSTADVVAQSQQSELHNIIYNGLSSAVDEIDLKKLNIPQSQASIVKDAYFTILYENPELFYVEYKYQI